MEKFRLLDFTEERLTTEEDMKKRAVNRERIAREACEYKAPLLYPMKTLRINMKRSK